MGITDPDLNSDLPPAVKEYVLARRWWVETAYDQATHSDAAWVEYERATKALKCELQRHGGIIKCGRITYELDPRGRGIAITIDLEGEDCEQAQVREDLERVKQRRPLLDLGDPTKDPVT